MYPYPLRRRKHLCAFAGDQKLQLIPVVCDVFSFTAKQRKQSNKPNENTIHEASSVHAVRVASML